MQADSARLPTKVIYLQPVVPGRCLVVVFLLAPRPIGTEMYIIICVPSGRRAAVGDGRTLLRQ